MHWLKPLRKPIVHNIGNLYQYKPTFKQSTLLKQHMSYWRSFILSIEAKLAITLPADAVKLDGAKAFAKIFLLGVSYKGKHPKWVFVRL